MNGIGHVAAALGALAVGAGLAGCGGGGSGSGGSKGLTAVVLTDAPIQVANESRTVQSLFVDIRRIELDRDRSGPSGDDDDNDRSGDDRREDEDDEVVFDMRRDNGGQPLRVDLLALTTSGQLIGTRNLRVGTYDEAEIELTAAFAEFADAPGTLVPLVLAGDDDEPDEFEFDLVPPVVVTQTATTVAVIDFAPIVTRSGATYVLTHDDEDDDSGQDDDGVEDLHVTGRVATVSGDFNTITLDGVAFAIDVSTAKVEADDLPDSTMSLAPGQTVEVEGTLDAASGVLVATEVEIQ